MRFGKLVIRLRTAIALFVSVVVFVSLLFTGILIGFQEAKHNSEVMSDQAMNVAEAVAHTPLVVKALEGLQSKADVQSYTLQVQQATGVRFIVVMDMNHIRLSHPNPEMIGQHFVGGDEGPAMQGKSYVSVAEGTLGTSLRAFVPIFADDGQQVGVVSVGIMLDHVNQFILSNEHIIYFGLAVGILIGISGALILATKIKRVLFGLEPHELGQLWQERNALLESVREGVLAVDRQLTTTVVNAEALRMFRAAGMMGNPERQSPDAWMPEVRFAQVLQTGQAQLDMEYERNGFQFVANLVPITLGDENIGVVATFRDKTELKQLAEQLTGVKLYADSLRSQTHEFINRLHVILSLIHEERYDRLAQYIDRITNSYQADVGLISDLVREPVLAGFLLGKLSFARESQVNMELAGRGIVPLTDNPELIDDLVTVFGNLIDNAFEAVANASEKHILIYLTYEAGQLTLTICDSGSGVPAEIAASMYDRGFSTKGSDRGYGLHLVLRCVERLGGTIQLQHLRDGDQTGFHIQQGVYNTMFTVIIPYPEGN